MKILSSSIFLLWQNLPVIVRAIVSGSIVAAAGTVPWAILVALNVKYGTVVPWAVPLTAFYLWFFWQYFTGTHWNKSTAKLRKKYCRANDLSGEVWGIAILAGMLGLWALVLFQNVYSRIVILPTQSSENLSNIPLLSLVLFLIMSAIVAGVTEEASFRGYMQGPLEKRYGPIAAILITATIFGFVHFSHREVTLALMPWYIGVGVIYGALAYFTNSIMPGLVLHAGGNMLNVLSVFGMGRTEWQTSSTSQQLIWETGTDIMFWISFAGFIIVTGAAVWSYRALAHATKYIAGTRYVRWRSRVHWRLRKS